MQESAWRNGVAGHPGSRSGLKAIFPVDPMKPTIIALSLIVVASLVFALLRPGTRPVAPPQAAAPIENLPWQIETLADGGSKVFGLVLAQSTLGEARQRFGHDMEIAVIASPGEPGALEAYYLHFTAGVLQGKMILVAMLDQAGVKQMRERAIKSEFMDSTTRKFILHPDDVTLAYQAPIGSITFIPDAHFDADTAVKRFGEPEVRLRSSETMEHFLYPQKGLDLLLDTQGKEVLQYIAPRQFARLRDPLVKKALQEAGQRP